MINKFNYTILELLLRVVKFCLIISWASTLGLRLRSATESKGGSWFSTPLNQRSHRDVRSLSVAEGPEQSQTRHTGPWASASVPGLRLLVLTALNQRSHRAEGPNI
ncbi:Uncharacterised protein [Sphingobacterium daejeonense]|nr:Uncharacterised protein [Sphingobacterium daejeonense]